MRPGTKADAIQPIPCRFAEKGCQSLAVEIVHVPEGCICWRDPVQALCEQHLITLESTGPTRTLFSLRPIFVTIRAGDVPMSERGREAMDALIRQAGMQFARGGVVRSKKFDLTDDRATD